MRIPLLGTPGQHFVYDKCYNLCDMLECNFAQSIVEEIRKMHRELQHHSSALLRSLTESNCVRAYMHALMRNPMATPRQALAEVVGRVKNARRRTRYLPSQAPLRPESMIFPASVANDVVELVQQTSHVVCVVSALQPKCLFRNT